MVSRLLLAFALLPCLWTCAPTTKLPDTASEVLILGDSQISFGAGAAYTKFFSDIGSACPNLPAAFHKAKSAAIGVRSTALHHWTSRATADRAPICDIDPTYGVNAGAYGVTSPGRSYVQIGQDSAYPFCPAQRTSLQAVFDAPAFDPDLIVLSFLGNAIDRWQNPATARADWTATTAQLPNQVACIVMTSIPHFEAATNAKRRRAQNNLGQAVKDEDRCAFVPGLTPATLAAYEGNPTQYRTDSDGRVTDPGHPTEMSAARFIALQTPTLCAALAQVLPD